jgi:serine/threonine protein kinase
VPRKGKFFAFDQGSRRRGLCALLRSVHEHYHSTISADHLHRYVEEERARWSFFHRHGYLLYACHKRTWLNTIYKGIQLVDRKPVAVKLLALENYPELIKTFGVDRDQMISRFQREVRVLTHVCGHHGMLAIVDSGEIHGTPYHVCNWVDGRSLSEMLDQGSWSMSLYEKLITIIQVADSVRRLHSLNLVHRDLAPDHIYVKGDQKTCIIDFGMAEYISENSVGEAQRYIRHDIFSIGLMLCELWLGKKCFSYGRPDLTNEVVCALSDRRTLSQLAPIAGVFGRAMACDARIAHQATASRVPYPDVASFIADLNNRLESIVSYTNLRGC